MRKHKGFADQLLTFLMCLLLLFIVISSFINYYSLLNIKRGIEGTVRGCMLLYESGASPTEVRTTLEAKLEQQGYKNGTDGTVVTIKISPNNPTYGDTIGIELSVKVNSAKLKIAKVQNIFKKDYTFNVRQYSVSKAE